MRKGYFISNAQRKIMRKIVGPLALLMSVAGAGSAIAESARVDFNGTVAAIPCVVDGQSSVDVDMGNIQASLLDSSIVSPWVNFQIKVKNCPAISAVTATVSGTVDTVIPALYKNFGSASNTALQLANMDTSAFISPVVPTTTALVNPDRTAVFNLAVRAYRVVAQGTIPGTINTVLQVNFTYQ
ncbi:MAG: fimbrial protein [Silvania sp.]|uniref:fimbrial protein n=1 Tax=Silvania sp. TaxID=3016633 RepID=UPI003EE56829